MNVNVNNAACMTVKKHIGYDTFINVCSGKTYDVAWTAIDCVAFAFVAFFIIALIIGGFWMVRDIIKDM